MRDVAFGLVGGLAAAAVCLLLCPYTLQEWVGGVARYSLINLGLRPFSGFVATWITRPHVPLLLVSFAVLAGLALWRVVVSMRRVSGFQAVTGAVCLALFGFVLFRTAFVKSEAAYNAIVWLPLFAAVALPAATRWAGWIALLIALSLPVAGLSRSALLLWNQASTGPSYAEVRAVAQRHLAEGLAVSPGLFIATPDLRQTLFGSGQSYLAAARPVWFLDQQVATGRTQPPDYEGYDLVENTFAGPVKIFAMPISRAPTGWQFALYRRQGAESAEWKD